MSLLDTKFAIIDVETTGTSSSDQVVDIAVVELHQGKIRHLFSSLVKPTIPIPPEASAVHHITDKMVTGAPSIIDVMATVDQLTQDHIAVAHNAAFDSLFVPRERWLCTYRLARHLWPDAPGHSNQVLRYWLGVDLDTYVHRAAGDAMVTAHLLDVEIKQYLANGSPDNLQALMDFSNSPIRAYKMPFGKHKGTLMSEVPTDYIQWALSKMGYLDDDMRRTMELILAERSEAG